MIYLNCEVKSGLGEDTFWTWFEREFPNSSFDVPEKLNDDDILLRYSTLGFLPIEGKQVAICWELYPQMIDFFGIDMWDDRLQKIYSTARYSSYRTVATQESVKDYERFGSVEVIPIGVNTDMYRPMDNKKELREKYNIPQDKEVGIWIGTCHPMKGFDELLKYASKNPDIYWICIWKWEMEATRMDNALNFVQIPQEQIAELVNCADFFLSTNKLSSYFMAEWEAMACDIPFRIIETTKREFYPSDHPRNDVFERGWDRKSVSQQWKKFFSERGVSW